MFAGGMLGAGVLGVVVERFAYRPLRNAPRIAPLISALGVSFFLANSVLLLTHGQRYNYAAYQLGGNPNTGAPGSARPSRLQRRSAGRSPSSSCSS